MEDPDYSFKFIVVGAMAVGKTSIVNRYVKNEFVDQSFHTVGVDFSRKIVEVDGKKVKIQIWDTAGQEKFRALTRNYFRNSLCVIFVMDLGRRTTFNQIDLWLKDSRSNNIHENAVLILVGNKKDLGPKRFVSYEEAEEYVIENNMFKYIETSALSDENIDELFMMAIREVLRRIENKEIVVQAESKDIGLASDGDAGSQRKASGGGGGCC